MKILITGTAGFIGFHLVQKLIERSDDIIGLDNINDYYDVKLKFGRLLETGISENRIKYNKILKSEKYNNYQFIKLNLEDKKNIDALFKNEKFDKICHLAAQAGVRYSLINPQAYIDSNVQGFINILEGARHYGIKHLVYASSSSVYGMNEKQPFSTSDNVDHPVSLYAATKKANELMAHTYSHLYGIPAVGLRFFTVYGPWGRPDMAYFLFTRSIMENKALDIFNNGNLERDFTYIDDIIEGLIHVINNPVTMNNRLPDGSSPTKAPYRLYNIGNNTPVKLMDFIETIEKHLGKTAKKNYLPMQPGDVLSTYADTSDLEKDYGFRPRTSIDQGIKKFVDWYKKFYHV
ncbi:MAG: NAD-dependent epimerase [Spirochaetes bacterium]|nr:NAD-dependent epimerase [Spirochaetota bacterium]